MTTHRLVKEHINQTESSPSLQMVHSIFICQKTEDANDLHDEHWPDVFKELNIASKFNNEENKPQQVQN